MGAKNVLFPSETYYDFTFKKSDPYGTKKSSSRHAGYMLAYREYRYVCRSGAGTNFWFYMGDTI